MRTRRWRFRCGLLDRRWRDAEQTGSIFGSGGVTLFGDEDEAPASGIGVNAPPLARDPRHDLVHAGDLDRSLWRRIITDWYDPPESPDERFKITV